MRHAKKQESMTHTQGKNSSQQQLSLRNTKCWNYWRKNLKAITNIFRELKATMFKELKESMRTMSYQIVNINKKIENIKKNDHNIVNQLQ